SHVVEMTRPLALASCAECAPAARSQCRPRSSAGSACAWTITFRGTALREPGARQRLLPDAENFGGEVSFDHLVGEREQQRRALPPPRPPPFGEALPPPRPPVRRTPSPGPCPR